MKKENYEMEKRHENAEGLELTETELTGVSGGAVNVLCKVCLLCPTKATCKKPVRFTKGCDDNKGITGNQRT